MEAVAYKDEHLTRQLDIIPLAILDTPITVIGAGAIGSWTTLALAKMGFANITVYDHDKVETVNLNAQVYGSCDVGRTKVAALHGYVKLMTGIDIDLQPIMYERQENREAKGIWITAVDSMKVRRMIWDSLKGKARNLIALIDPRMGAEEGMMLCMDVHDDKDIESYEKSLYTDEQAVNEPCTAKSTAYTALMLSGLVAKTVKDRLTGDYIRNCQWSIKNNHLIAWTAAGKSL